tara:strand:- start:287 stop:562 length:276 start_codon:yes stop_codon:yes gene_type:complete
MKIIILAFTLFLVTSGAYTHDHSLKFRVICERIQGCPTFKNATNPKEYCPTCIIINNGTDKIDFTQSSKEFNEDLRYLWDKHYFKNNHSQK